MPYALITVACQGDSKMPGGYGAILANIRPDLNFKSWVMQSRKLLLGFLVKLLHIVYLIIMAVPRGSLSSIVNSSYIYKMYHFMI
jgi:hypothetical protein